ncbi:T9SS type A sorting domain-containing protein [Cyclobacterium plantarum]|uniref:T9SS type A sorting domain-containing protein n=1 Tax=Cyclobacterium plantarum TaxID=2716263 RepID=UPI003F6F06EC
MTRWKFFRLLLFPMFFLGAFSLSAQVQITGTQNNIAIEEVRLRVSGSLHVQTTDPASRNNPAPNTDPVIIETILLQNGTEIFATTRTPEVRNLHPYIGSNSIAVDAVGVAKYDGATISHRSADFPSAIEEVVSTPDLRSYWDIGGGSIPSGETFMDIVYPEQVPKSGYLVVSERDGNSKFNFQALDENGEPIPGAETLELRGYEWNTQVVNQGNYPGQPQHLVVISPELFDTNQSIFGFRVINIDGADGKIVFFRNSIQVHPDEVEPVFPGDTAVVNVLQNDELMEQQATVSNVSVHTNTGVPGDFVVLRADGFVDVDPDAPAGTYIISYSICEIGNDTNCDSGTVTIEVMSALPVVWLDFMATEVEDGNLVVWKTSREENNKEYQVWRSSNPLAGFEMVGEVGAIGESTAPLQYTFKDTRLYPSGNLYYKIVQVDLDGKKSSTSVFRLGQKAGKARQFHVYPNPHYNGPVNVEFDSGLQHRKVSISIQNHLGHVLFAREGTGQIISRQFRLQLGSMPSGFYILVLRSEKEVSMLRWVKS